MKVVITGGAGFLGRRLAQTLLQRGTLCNANGEQETIETLTLFDVMQSEMPNLSDSRLQVVIGDIVDADTLAQVIDARTSSVFHFAAVVSAAAEADFDLGMRINVMGTLSVLDACRKLPQPPRVVFTSSVASFGGALPEVVDRHHAQHAAIVLRHPEGHRRSVDQRLLSQRVYRWAGGSLATIVVRPGKPNQAASSFASGIIREPLNGVASICPVVPETRVAILSPRRAVDAFVHAHDLPAAAWGTHRSLNVPGLSVEVREMVEALHRVAGDRSLGPIHWEPDAEIQRIVGGWPGRFTSACAIQLGFQTNADMDEIIRDFIADDLSG